MSNTDSSNTGSKLEISSLYSSSEHERKEKGEVDVDNVTATSTQKEEEESPVAVLEEEPGASEPQQETTSTQTDDKNKLSSTDKKDNDGSDSESSSEDETPRFKPRRSSIKLKTLTADIPVKLGRKSFRALPVPDMDKVRRAATLPAYMSPEDVFRAMSGTNHEEDRGDLNVRFDNVNIRNYKQTLGDNPSVSYGPPIGLDWNYEEQKAISLEDYEQLRDGKRRPYKKLGLNYFQRKALLEKEGHTQDEIKAGKKQANKDKFKRAITKYFLPVQKLEDAAESSMRKLKRGMGKPRRQSDPTL